MLNIQLLKKSDKVTEKCTVVRSSVNMSLKLESLIHCTLYIQQGIQIKYVLCCFLQSNLIFGFVGERKKKAIIIIPPDIMLSLGCSSSPVWVKRGSIKKKLFGNMSANIRKNIGVFCINVVIVRGRVGGPKFAHKYAKS